MKIKNVELKTIGQLGGKVRIVSPTLFKLFPEKESDTDNYVSLKELFSSLMQFDEETFRSIMADARFYYQTEFKTITFKEWCLLKNTKDNYVPNILLIEGLINSIHFERNDEKYIVETVLEAFEKKPINVLRGKYDIAFLIRNLYKKYIKYVKKLRTVHKFNIDENKVMEGEL